MVLELDKISLIIFEKNSEKKKKDGEPCGYLGRLFLGEVSSNAKPFKFG